MVDAHAKIAEEAKSGHGAALRSMHADDIIFLCAYCVWLTFELVFQKTFFAASISTGFVLAVRYACFGALVLSEIISIKRGIRWSWRSAVALAITAVLMLCCYNAHSPHMMWGMPFLFCMRNRNLTVILKASIYIMVAILVITTLCSQLGIIEDYIFQGSRTRHCLGFRYPLYPSAIMLMVTCLTVVTQKDKLNWGIIVLLVLANALMFTFTDSRLSFGLSILAVAIGAVLKVIPRKKPAAMAPACILSCMVIIAAGVSIAATVAFDANNPAMAHLNGALAGRLSLGHSGLENMGISLFGQKVVWVGSGLSATGASPKGTYNFVDCLYVRGSIMYGVAFIALYIAGMTAASYKAFRSGDYYLGLILLVVAIHGMIDNQTEYPWGNPLMLSAMVLFSELENGKARLRSKHQRATAANEEPRQGNDEPQQG